MNKKIKYEHLASLVTVAAAMLVYGGLAYAIAAAIDGSKETFHAVFLVLLGGTVVVHLLQFLVGVISWRTFGRRAAVASYIERFQWAGMPKRVFESDEITGYLCRLNAPGCNDYKPDEVPPSAKRLAAELNTILMSCRALGGMMVEVRTWRAMDDALDAYSPRDEAPPIVYPGLLWALRDGDVPRCEWLKVPGIPAGLIDSILAERPFDTYREFYTFLRDTHGMSHHDAALMMIEMGRFIEAHHESKATHT